MALKQMSPEVFLAEGPIATVGPDEIRALRTAVGSTSKGRARINAHSGSADALHEMVIAIDRRSYIRPHMHPAKSESFHIVEGSVDIVLFDEAGEIDQLVGLAAPGGDHPFYYRMSAPFYHTLVIRSDILIVHEITNGPFTREGTLFATFAPADDDTDAAQAYQDELRRRVDAFTAKARA